MSAPYERGPKAFLWFAWRPVWTRERGWVWLRLVLRRHIPPLLGVPGAVWVWEYTIPEVTPRRPHGFECCPDRPHEGGTR